MEKKLIKIKLPLTRNDKEDVFVGINGHTWQIARGVEVELPWNVVKVLERQEKMLAQALEFEEKAAKPLEQLEKKVEQHNTVIERQYKLEKKFAEHERDYAAACRRIEELEKGE